MSRRNSYREKGRKVNMRKPGIEEIEEIRKDANEDDQRKPAVKIPKIIMQTWKNQNVPLHWLPSPQSIQEQMPDWTYRLMTDEDNRNFVAEHFPDFLPYYDKFEYPIQRADAIRYCWLYVNGGIYIDLDIELLQPLDPLFIDDIDLFLVASGNIGSCITNSFMASKPRSPFWLEVIEEMKKPPSAWSLGKHWKVMNTTGPLMLDRVAKRSKYTYSALPSKLIMPCSVCDNICQPKGAYVRPLPGQSWCGIDSMCYNFLLCNWRKILWFFLFVIIAIILYFIVRRMTR